MENRKTTHPEEDDDDFLTLSLSLSRDYKRTRYSSPSLSVPPPSHTPPSPFLLPLQQQLQSYSRLFFSLPKQALRFQTSQQMPVEFTPDGPLNLELSPPPPPSVTIPELQSRPVRSRRNTSSNDTSKETKTIPPPYPWATNRPAIVHSISYLIERKILTITGMVRCTKCEKDYEMSLDLMNKFSPVCSFIVDNMNDMRDRAPNVWMTPTLLTCKYCSRETARPIISENKETINWLFLFLGQLLGCCTLEQLKYFCGCTQNHRTGAKDRVLYLTYLGIFKQLAPHVSLDSL